MNIQRQGYWKILFKKSKSSAIQSFFSHILSILYHEIAYINYIQYTIYTRYNLLNKNFNYKLSLCIIASNTRVYIIFARIRDLFCWLHDARVIERIENGLNSPASHDAWCVYCRQTHYGNLRNISSWWWCALSKRTTCIYTIRIYR